MICRAGLETRVRPCVSLFQQVDLCLNDEHPNLPVIRNQECNAKPVCSGCDVCDILAPVGVAFIVTWYACERANNLH